MRNLFILLSIVVATTRATASSVAVEHSYSLEFITIEDDKVAINFCYRVNVDSPVECFSDGRLYSYDDIGALEAYTQEIADARLALHTRIGGGSIGASVLLVGFATALSGGVLTVPTAIAIGGAGVMGTLGGGAYLSGVQVGERRSQQFIEKLSIDAGNLKTVVNLAGDSHAWVLMEDVERALYGIRNNCFNQPRARRKRKCLKGYNSSNQRVMIDLIRPRW